MCTRHVLGHIPFSLEVIEPSHLCGWDEPNPRARIRDGTRLSEPGSTVFEHAASAVGARRSPVCSRGRHRYQDLSRDDGSRGVHRRRGEGVDRASMAPTDDRSWPLVGCRRHRHRHCCGTGVFRPSSA